VRLTPTCHYQGVSHAEWPKNNDEYAPPQIGAAFMHQDGEGFNIVLQALPINGKIVLRPPKAQSEETQAPGAKSNVRPLKNRRDK